jgi:hypothetical protein
MTKRNISILQKKAEVALREAVRHVVEDHKRIGEPLVIWEKGKVKLVPPTQRLIRKLKK